MDRPKSDFDRWVDAMVRIRRLEDDVCVPGLRRCPRCGAEQRFEATGPDGPVPVETGESVDCPNCTTPMWRVSERSERERLEALLAERPSKGRVRRLLVSAFATGLRAAGGRPEDVMLTKRMVAQWADEPPKADAAGGGA
ncbi:hypothetical protein GCM10011390_02570 [Aureimonas endophytica]|uniref:Uncharacterized protein n=1 Tax=Aureimonas endophytica TaxID=2027858 RepID=A0A916ZC34_9HYPH|nr:hypothetical protein [Aureimonas endophytica]GGD87345.1 hypothetical protein GCM10011390_02570 [Aureimonas endophytica]